MYWNWNFGNLNIDICMWHGVLGVFCDRLRNRHRYGGKINPMYAHCFTIRWGWIPPPSPNPAKNALIRVKSHTILNQIYIKQISKRIYKKGIN